MCGKDRCMYYGCDMCGWRLKGEIIHLHRDECDCLNDTYAELCSDQCRHAYERDILECTCGSTNPIRLSRGPSQK